MFPSTAEASGNQPLVESEPGMVSPCLQGGYLSFQLLTGESRCAMFLSSISRNASGDITGCLQPVVCNWGDDGLVEAELV